MFKWLLFSAPFLLCVCNAAQINAIGIEFYSTMLSDKGCVDANKAAIEADYAAGKTCAGYCKKDLQSLSLHSNHNLCPGGSTKNIGQRFAVTFFEPIGGVNWVFKVFIDSGYGYSVYLDDNKIGAVTADVWTAATNPRDYTLNKVSYGFHTFFVYGGEGCCDGEAGAWQVKRDNKEFLPLTVKNLYTLKSTLSIGIRYYSTQLTNQGCVNANKAAIEADYTAGELTTGYCKKDLQNLSQHSNKNLCPGGSTKNIGQRFAVTFFEPTGGVNWVFKVFIDSEYGYSVYLDDNKIGAMTGDVWTAATNPRDYTLTNVAYGFHAFFVYGGEGCCDGEAGAWQVKRNGLGFLPLTVQNLQFLKLGKNVGIEYYSTMLSDKGCVDANKAAIEADYTSGKASTGYCKKDLQNLSQHSNKNLCTGGSTKNIGQRFAVTFFEPTGGVNWVFRVFIDSGYGYSVSLDGNKIGAVTADVWTAATNPRDYTLNNVCAGFHTFYVHGGEGCCDGEAGAWQVKRDNNCFLPITVKNLESAF